MVDCCDICGDTGIAGDLLICNQCKTYSEHVYCLRTPLEEPVDDWRCEECESSNKLKPVASPLVREMPGVSKVNSRKVHFSDELLVESTKSPNKPRVNWEKMVATGKTKYIPVNEAIKLSAEEKKSFAPSNFTRRSKAPRSKIGINISERSAVRPLAPPNFCSQQDHASGPFRKPRTPRLGNKKGQLQRTKKLTEVLRSTSSLQPSQAPKSKYMQKEQPTEIPLTQTKTRILVKQSSEPSLNASPVTISGANVHTTTEQRIGGVENMNSSLFPNLEKWPCTPALDALWKGSFSIQGDYRHGELSHQIQAHPPSKVRRKVYEFSKKMPEALHFQLVPARKYWISLFKYYIPDERDIALYFFPSVRERLEDYICLLESISERDLALRIQISDVELLVFTSKFLHVDCQCWEGEYYLWGVFHRLRRDDTACLDKKLLELSVQPSNDANNANNQVDDSEEVDMEIDMIGGINVGRMDIPVQREPIEGKSASFREESAAATALPGSSPRKITSVSRRISDPGTIVPLLNVKMEPCDNLIPPGFEDIYMLRMQGASSLVENVGGPGGKTREPDDLRSFPSK